MERVSNEVDYSEKHVRYSNQKGPGWGHSQRAQMGQFGTSVLSGWSDSL